MSIIDTSEIELGRRPLWQNYCGERSAPRVFWFLSIFRSFIRFLRMIVGGARASPVVERQPRSAGLLGAPTTQIPLDTGFYDLRNQLPLHCRLN